MKANANKILAAAVPSRTGQRRDGRLWVKNICKGSIKKTQNMQSDFR